MQAYELQREEIEAVKLSAQALPYRGVSIHDTFAMSVKKLYVNYEATGDKRYLECALLQMQAYLEMGFVYESEREIFDKVLKELGTDKGKQFPKRYYAAETVKLTRPQVRKMIRRWSSSIYHTMPIDRMVDDIIEKVQNREYGTYYYHSCYSPDRSKNPADEVYELVVQKNECFFHDINGQKYYEFVE